MSRIRSIKPEFWTSEQVMECSPLARLLFVGLWNFCDDNGVHPASCKTLKAEIFPADDITSQAVGALVAELIAQGLLAEFEHEGKRYWFVTGWHHQKIDRPSPAKYPLPPKQKRKIVDDSPNARRGLDEDSTNSRDGIEGNGIVIENTPPSFFSETPPASARVAESMPEPPKKEKKADEWNRDSRNKPIPADWEPQDATLAITAGLGIPGHFAADQVPLFRLHHTESGTQRGGFESLFVGWCKKAWALKAEERSPGERRKGETMLEHSQRLRRMYLEPDQPGERLLEGEVIRAH